MQQALLVKDDHFTSGAPPLFRSRSNSACVVQATQKNKEIAFNSFAAAVMQQLSVYIQNQLPFDLTARYLMFCTATVKQFVQIVSQ